jgi:hypothetical protein
VQAALVELQGEIDARAVSTTLASTSGAGLIGTLTSANVETTLVNLDTEKADTATLGASGGGSLIGIITPAGSTATNVQDALDELFTGGAALPGAMASSIAITFGFAGEVSALPTNSGGVRIHSQADCFLEFGAAGVTTTSSSLYFAAGTEVFGIPSGATHIAVKTAGEAGVLNVVGLDEDYKEELVTNTMIPVSAGSNTTSISATSKIRLFSMTDCYIDFNTTVDDTGLFFEAGTEILEVPAGATDIAAKRYTTDGGLYITGIN